jgi:microcystin-dependent protein
VTIDNIVIIDYLLNQKIYNMKRIILTILIAVGLTATSFSQEQFIGEVRIFAGTFAPRGWAFCNGQSMPVNQYAALYSVLGTTYGGDGITSFKLPDLRGRTPFHAGYSQGPGLSTVLNGEVGGTETNTVLPPNVSVKTNNVSLDTQTTGRDGAPMVVTSVVVNNPTAPQVITNRPPYLGMNYIICVEGYYPVRN